MGNKKWSDINTPTENIYKIVKICALLAASSFFLLLIAIAFYPGEYQFFQQTISELAQLTINGELNITSFPILTLSHFCFSLSITLACLKLKEIFNIDDDSTNNMLIRIAKLLGLLGALSIFIVAIMPMGVPEVFHRIHYIFAVFMFPCLLGFGVSIFILSYRKDGLCSFKTVVPILLSVIFALLAVTFFYIDKYELVNDFSFIIVTQKAGYHIFILGLVSVLFFIQREIKIKLTS